jgi:hypothetical protein
MKNVLLTLLVVLMLVVSANAEWVSFSEKYGEWEYPNGTYDSVSYDTDEGYAFCSITATDDGDDGYVNCLSIWDYGIRWQGGGTSTAGTFRYKLSGSPRSDAQGMRYSGSAECSSSSDAQIYVDGFTSWNCASGDIIDSMYSAYVDDYCYGGTTSENSSYARGVNFPVPSYGASDDRDFSPDDWEEISVSAGETVVYVSVYCEVYASASVSGSGSISAEGGATASASLDMEFNED